MNIHQFDHVYLINLDKRKDRLLNATKELSELNLLFERFSAVDGDKEHIDWHIDPVHANNPNYGWNKYSAALAETTIRIIRDAIEKNYKHILIFEDDIQFEKNTVNELKKAIFPKDPWHFFYFGAFHSKLPSYYNSTVIKLNFSLCLHAYAVHSSIFKEYLNKLEARNMPIDWVVATHFQPLGLSYSLRNPIAKQYPNYSDIKQADVNYTDLFVDLTN